MKAIKIAWLLWLAFIINLAISITAHYFPDRIPDFPIQLSLNAFFLLFSTFILVWNYRFQMKIKVRKLLASNAEIPKNDAHYSNQFLLENIPNLLCIKDAKGRWLLANPEYLKAFNLQNSPYIGKTDLELSTLPGVNVDALNSNASKDKQAWSKGSPISESNALSTSEGQLPFETTRIPIQDKDQNKYRLFITGQFIDPSQASESKIFSSIFFTSHQAFLLLDSNLQIIRINNSFTQLTGLTENDSVNQPLSIFNKSDHPEDFIQTIKNFFQYDSEQLWSGEITCRRHSQTFPAKLIISSIRPENKSDKISHFFANILDITQQKIDENRILKIAHYDNLTGLPNRIMFYDRLGQFLSAAKRHQLHTVVLFIDLDRFKAVNDSLGHQAGDELLKEVAERLLKQTRKEDVVSRLSGDEFAILLLNEHSHDKAIYAVSLIAQKIINELSRKFYIQRQEVFIGASIGIAIYPEDAKSVELLLKHADIAMYEAKNQGRNNFQFFHKKFTAEAQDKRKLEVDLRKALEKSELRLYYQPQYNTATKEIWGAEVLVRWFKDQTKMIPPDYFISVAEETGLIIPIGTWILKTACRQLKYWQDEGLHINQISVNVSARQFADHNFMDIVEQTLQETGINPQYLELEITESMLVGDINKIELQLNRLKEMGIKIALDDFGTGYSSLSYLKNFPIDILKIDQSFIREMTPRSKDAEIVCAIIEMGHSLGQKVIAEGVENEGQFSYLKNKTCDIIQGYYFNPPLQQEEMTKLLRDAPTLHQKPASKPEPK